MEKRIRFLDQLKYAKRNGISIDVDGVSYMRKPASDVIRIMQQGNYMVDYDSNTSGHITAIHVREVKRNV